jgi:branched-chain amino acid transport system permease protein
MIFGIILVLMMIFRPQGIFPARRRQRELAQAQVQKEQVAVVGAEP